MLLNIRIRELIDLHFLHHIFRWFDRNYIMIVLLIGQLCSRFFSLGLRLALYALRTSSVERLYSEPNEALLSFRRERLVIQYYKHLQPCPSNPAFECIIIPQCDFFARKESNIPTLVLEFNQYWMTVILLITTSIRLTFLKFLIGLIIQKFV